MPHYQILRCEANQEDCSYSWDVKLTEFGYCISNKIINNLSTGNWANSIYFSFQHIWTYCFPYEYFYLVTVMLVTSLCWWLYDGPSLMVTVFRCWWQNHYVGDFFCYVGDFLNVLNRPPTSQTCHQQIWSLTSVTNIDVTHGLLSV